MSPPDYFLRGQVRRGSLSSEPFAIRLQATDESQASDRANHDRNNLQRLAAPGVIVDAFLTTEPAKGTAPPPAVSRSWAEIGALADPALNDWFVGAAYTHDTKLSLADALRGLADAVRCLGPLSNEPGIHEATNAASFVAFAAANAALRTAVHEAGGGNEVHPSLDLESEDLQDPEGAELRTDWNSPAQLAYLASTLAGAANAPGGGNARRIDGAILVDRLVAAMRDIPAGLPVQIRPYLIEPYCTLVESFAQQAPAGYREAVLWAVARFRGEVGREPRALSSAIDLLEAELAHWRAGGTKT